jgi:hypothetical protein
MVVITSIFVAEVQKRFRGPEMLDRELKYEDLPAEQSRRILRDTARELISMYEGKNRVEPME